MINKKLIFEDRGINFIVAKFDFRLNKSTRKNSKSTYKDFWMFNNYSLNINTIKQFIEYHIIQKKLYKNDNLTCVLSLYDINQNIRIKLEKRHSIEQYINDYYILLELVSKQKFNFTLKELHNDSNIRFLINEYYRGVK